MKQKHFATSILIFALTSGGFAAAYGAGLIPKTKPFHVRKDKVLVRSEMKDPGSTKFSDIEVSKNGVVCGDYNSKNAYGAYAGPVGFVASAGRVVFNTGYNFNEFMKESRYVVDAADYDSAKAIGVKLEAWCAFEIAYSGCPSASPDFKKAAETECALNREFHTKTLSTVAQMQSYRY